MKKIFIIISLFLMSISLFNPVIQSSNNKNTNFYLTEYEFLWETLLDAPGYIEGDDSVVWGPDLGPYYNYSELTDKLIDLNTTFPDIVDLFSIGRSCLGKDLWMVRLTDESVRINKHGFLMVGQHHGREAITVMNSLFTIDRFVSDYFENSSMDELSTSIPFIYYHGEKNPPLIQSLLRDTEIFILPALNPDALDILHINPWQRKNLCEYDDNFDGNATNNLIDIQDLNNDGFIEEYYANGQWTLEGGVTEYPGGTDLNRNYNFSYLGSGNSPNNDSNLFRGPNPFSEPETKALRDWTLSHNSEINYALSLHSGVEAVIGPWGHTSGPDNDLYHENRIANSGLKSITGYPNWDEFSGYVVNGDWGDWTYGFANIFAFTLETYGNSSAVQNNKGIWDYFNPNANEIIRRSETIYESAYFLASSPSPESVALPLINNIKREFITSSQVRVTWELDLTDINNLNKKIYQTNIFVSSDGLNDWRQIGSSYGLGTFIPSKDLNENDWIKFHVDVGNQTRIYSTIKLSEIKIIFEKSIFSDDSQDSVSNPVTTSDQQNNRTATTSVLSTPVFIIVLSILVLFRKRKN